MISSMEFDDEFLQMLEALQLDSELNLSSLKLLNQEARNICEENTPGNFVQLPEGDAASALLLAWVVRNSTREPRNLFVPDAILRRYANQFELLGSSWIKPVDRLLREEGHARNWLGMLALIHAKDIPIASCLPKTCDLLAGQFVEHAKIIIDEESDSINDFMSIPASLKNTFSPQFKESSLVLDWQGQFLPDKRISSDLVDDFSQDDPLACGIATLMSANERFQLYYVVRNLLPMAARPIRFIEVGSFAGGTFYEICRAFQRNGLPFQGIAVEPAGQPSFHKVMHYFSDNAVHLEMYSHEAALKLERLFFAGSLPEFILIDGDHSYEGVCSDIVDYYPLLAPGGIVMFHDYLPPVTEQNKEFIISRTGGTGPGIGDACRDLLEKRQGLKPLELPRLYPTNPSQTLASQAIIPGVYSTIRAYRKPVALKGA